MIPVIEGNLDKMTGMIRTSSELSKLFNCCIVAELIFKKRKSSGTGRTSCEKTI